MGYRTVVILFNDQSNDWSNDPDLGKKIQHASSFLGYDELSHKTDFGGGRVVECAHADVQRVGVFDGYSFHSLASSNWVRGKTTFDMSISLIKKAADALGYRLVKKASK